MRLLARWDWVGSCDASTGCVSVFVAYGVCRVTRIVCRMFCTSVVCHVGTRAEELTATVSPRVWPYIYLCVAHIHHRDTYCVFACVVLGLCPCKISGLGRFADDGLQHLGISLWLLWIDMSVQLTSSTSLTLHPQAPHLCFLRAPWPRAACCLDSDA